MMQRVSLRQVSPALFLVTFLGALAAIGAPTQAATAPAITVKFTKIAQSDEPAPGTDQIFEDNFRTTAISGSKVVFQGTFRPNGVRNTVSSFGLYQFKNGTLQKLVDQNTIVPRSNQELFGDLNIGDTLIQNDQVIFSTYDFSSGTYSLLGRPIPKIKGGIYKIKNNQLSVIADTETVDPTTGRKFSGFGLGGFRTASVSYGIGASNDQVVFLATTLLGKTQVFGLQSFQNGKFSTLIDENTINPLTGQPLAETAEAPHSI